MKTQCNNDHSYLIYIGRIVGTDTLRPSVILDLLEKWSRKGASVVRVASTQLNIDQDCPIYLSSPSDPNCARNFVTPSSSPASSPTTAEPVVPTEDTSDKETNHVPIYTACIVGGFFLGCFLTLFIVIVVFFCRIKRRKKETEEYVFLHAFLSFSLFICFVAMLFMLDLVEETKGLGFLLRIA